MKGFIIDPSLILLPALLVFLAITIVVASYLNTSITPALNSTIQSQSILRSSATTFSVWNYMFIFFIVAIGLINVISAMLINSHPVFFFASLIILIGVGIISPQMSNVYDTFANSPAISAEASKFGAMNFAIGILPFIMLTIGIVTAIIMHGKPIGQSAI